MSVQQALDEARRLSRCGEITAAYAVLERALAEATHADTLARFACPVELAQLDWDHGHYERCRDRCASMLPTLRQGGEPAAPWLGRCLLLLSASRDLLDEPVLERDLVEALGILEPAGSLWEAAQSAGMLGDLARARGDRRAAGAWLRQARDLYARSGSRLGGPNALRKLAELAVECGDLDNARSALDEALSELATVRLLGARLEESRSRELLGDLQAGAGNREGARESYRLALAFNESQERRDAERLRSKLEGLKGEQPRA